MNLDGASILVTGGTGSFGNAFVDRVLNTQKPERITVLSRDELKQFQMRQRFPISDYPNLRMFIGDVRDRDRVFTVMEDVDIVIHAAALKQIPAAELNPLEAIKTNILGAANIVDAALERKVQKVIGLSTDKAANPINLYGATKLTSDKLFVAANNVAGEDRTRFSVVRYGNVVGSRGSVVPYFKRIIERGGDRLPITDPQMTRFWITLQQGVDFVLENFARRHGGEVFVPRIPSVRLVDLAEALGPGLPHEIIGIRPGEKIHEIMCPRDSAHLTLEFSDHFVLKPAIQFSNLADYSVNRLGEEGGMVEEGFEYNSGTNPHFLTVEEIASLNDLADA